MSSTDWTGHALQQWAERVAREIDAGRVDLTVDLDWPGTGDQHVTFHIVLTEEGRAYRDERRARWAQAAAEMAAEEGED